MAATRSTTSTVEPTTDDGDDALVEAIIQASRAMVGVAGRSLAEVAVDVTLPQYRTLVVLGDDGPRRLADLAEGLGVSPSTATRMCDRLVRKGLLDRRRDELDRREVNLALTPGGRRLVSAVIERRRELVHELLQAIPKRQRAGMVQCLNLVARADGAAPEPHWSSGWTA